MVFGIIAAVLAAMVLVAAYLSYRIVFYRDIKGIEPDDLPSGAQYDAEKEIMHALIEEMKAIPFERVCITSYDGLKLYGRYYHISNSAPLQIQFHGYRGNGIRDFSGGNKLAREMNHNTLVVDQRAHGKSEGRTITFGIKERFDCLSWVKYANKRFGSEIPVILAGVSMGAATVLMASDLSLPENVCGIIADCPYSSPSAIIKKVCGDLKLPCAVLYPFVYLGALVYGHFNLSAASAVKSVAHTKIPVLLIHGEDDRFVPCDMSREIFDACISYKERVTFPGAGHGMSYIKDPNKYSAAVSGFIAKCLSDKFRR